MYTVDALVTRDVTPNERQKISHMIRVTPLPLRSPRPRTVLAYKPHITINRNIIAHAAAVGSTGTRRTSTGSGKELVHSVRRYDGVDGVSVTIEASLDGDQEARVLWGVYKASPMAWQFPKAIEASDTVMDEGMGAMSTLMEQDKSGKFVASFRMPIRSAPLTFAYALYVRNGEHWRVVTPSRGGHFTVQVGAEQGSAGKLGSSLLDDGKLNFAVQCRGCDYVNLVLVQGADDGSVRAREFALDPVVNRTGHIWHVAINYDENILGYG